MTATIRVLLADDEALVRAGLAAILSVHDDLEVVGEATDGVEAVSLARRLKPDVTLMDLRMPRLDGIAATRRIVAKVLGRVLALTTFDIDRDVFLALEADASGFLLKSTPADALAPSIRTTHAGLALLGPSVVARLSRVAISALDNPSASSRSVSCSQAVSMPRTVTRRASAGCAYLCTSPTSFHSRLPHTSRIRNNHQQRSATPRNGSLTKPTNLSVKSGHSQGHWGRIIMRSRARPFRHRHPHRIGTRHAPQADTWSGQCPRRVFV